MGTIHYRHLADGSLPHIYNQLSLVPFHNDKDQKTPLCGPRRFTLQHNHNRPRKLGSKYYLLNLFRKAGAESSLRLLLHLGVCLCLRLSSFFVFSRHGDFPTSVVEPSCIYQISTNSVGGIGDRGFALGEHRKMCSGSGSRSAPPSTVSVFRYLFLVRVTLPSYGQQTYPFCHCSWSGSYKTCENDHLFGATLHS